MWGWRNEDLITPVLLFTHERVAVQRRGAAERHNNSRKWVEVLTPGCQTECCCRVARLENKLVRFYSEQKCFVQWLQVAAAAARKPNCWARSIWSLGERQTSHAVNLLQKSSPFHALELLHWYIISFFTVLQYFRCSSPILNCLFFVLNKLGLEKYVVICAF